MKRTLADLAVAFQFMTRLPLPRLEYRTDALSRAASWFPLVGLVVGLGAAAVHLAIGAHLPRSVSALLVLVYLVLITGALHEDGLADAADGFGGGWHRDQVLTIMRDSRIGSYGAIALVLSLTARWLLLSSLPAGTWIRYVIAAHVLCRWTTLPLSYFLKPARQDDGQAARIAQRTPRAALLAGTLLALALCFGALGMLGWAPVLTAILVTGLGAIYYLRRIGGITGDCFGATNQLTEIAVYLCGVWHL